MDLTRLREAVRSGETRLRITTHAQVEAAKGGLLLRDLQAVFFAGYVIDTSEVRERVLLSGRAVSAELPVHLVVEDTEEEGVIVTAYIPDPWIWESNWKRRRRRGEKE